MTTPVTATMLYDLITCPHRVTMDLFGDPDERNSPNPFVELLWIHGTLHEQKVMKELDIAFLDLSSYPDDGKERQTIESMQHGEALIYSGRIRVDGFLGNPTLLVRKSAIDFGVLCLISNYKNRPTKNTLTCCPIFQIRRRCPGV